MFNVGTYFDVRKILDSLREDTALGIFSNFQLEQLYIYVVQTYAQLL
jgi:hypothetical protein